MQVDHIAITVIDLDRSIDFYTKNFGFKLQNKFDKQGTRAKFAYIELKGFRLELWQFPENKIVKDDLEDLGIIGLRHLAFKVDDIEATHKQLVANGVNFSEIKTGSSGVLYCLGTDPDGIALELIQ